ncbi:MAG: serine hydrolase, partial [Pseudomonadota bacterium]
GIEMLRQYLEARFETPYAELTREILLNPLGIEGMSVSREPWLEGRVPHPVSGAGKVYEPFTQWEDGPIMPVGSVSGADNLYTTVPAYAKFLTVLLDADYLGTDVAKTRMTLLSSSDSELGYACIAEGPDCPDPIGYGAGWGLFGEPDRMVLNHGGNDFGEHAQVYFAPETGDGLVMFMNGGGAFPAGIEVLEMVEPDLLMAKHFRALINKIQEGEDTSGE